MLVLPYINYCCFVWVFTYQNYISKIELLQKRVVGIIDNQHRLAHSNPIFKSLNILKVRDIAQLQLISVMHRKMIGSLPKELDDMFLLTNNSNITRSRLHFKETVHVISASRCVLLQNSFTLNTSSMLR